MDVTIPSILQYLSIKEDPDASDSGHCTRAKKRRLDHLSWEEKQQRKKLKNRVAAQTSRDRKKARMEQMECAIRELYLKNESLLEECRELKSKNKKLSEENTQLRGKFEQQQNQSKSVIQDVEMQEKGSAESNPLPKGMPHHRPTCLTDRTLKTLSLTALWKIVLACLLYRTYSANLTETSTLNLWSSSHRVFYKISPQTWKRLLKKQISNNQQLIRDETILRKWWSSHHHMGPTPPIALRA